jgi:hypothetical protein
VVRGEEFPADMVFLSAMHEDPEQRGICHVQTAQLDGETNLKLRKGVDELVALFKSDDDCANFQGYVECENPTEHFGKFTGKLYMEEGGQVRRPCPHSSLLCSCRAAVGVLRCCA